MSNTFNCIYTDLVESPSLWKQLSVRELSIIPIHCNRKQGTEEWSHTSISYLWSKNLSRISLTGQQSLPCTCCFVPSGTPSWALQGYSLWRSQRISWTIGFLKHLWNGCQDEPGFRLYQQQHKNLQNRIWPSCLPGVAHAYSMSALRTQHKSQEWYSSSLKEVLPQVLNEIDLLSVYPTPLCGSAMELTGSSPVRMLCVFLFLEDRVPL